MSQRRHACQVTVGTHNTLLKQVYEDSGIEMAFVLEDWVLLASQESPTFKFWLLKQIPTDHIHLWISGTKFKLLIITQWKLVPLLFSLDHQNYTRWIPILIRELDVLPDRIHVDFENGHWMITHSNQHFLSLPNNHAHEQANKSVVPWEKNPKEDSN